MKHGIFSIHDSKTGAFMTPFTNFNNATALRTFSDAIKQPDTNLHNHPEDYSLHRIGTFEDDTGTVVPEPPKNLGLATEYKNDST